MPQPKQKPQSSKASRILLELGGFFKAFALFIYYKLTHPAEERWRTVALCLALSGTFWFLRAMTRPASLVVPFDVRIKYDKKKYYLPHRKLENFKASVTATGWDLAGIWVSLQSKPITYKPDLHKGYFKFKPGLLEDHLQNRFRRINVNYIVVPLDTLPVDSMITRDVKVQVIKTNDPTVGGFLNVCFFGPSEQLIKFPRRIDLTSLDPKAQKAGTVKSAFPKPWQEYICEAQRNQLLSNLMP